MNVILLSTSKNYKGIKLVGKHKKNVDVKADNLELNEHLDLGH